MSIFKSKLTLPTEGYLLPKDKDFILLCWSKKNDMYQVFEEADTMNEIFASILSKIPKDKQEGYIEKIKTKAKAFETLRK